MSRFNFITDKHYSIDRKSGCWNWLMALSCGYGRIDFQGKLWLAPRLAYSMFVGRIKRGLVIDHLCRNRRCINPKHLEPVTMAENIRRGNRAKLSRSDVEKIRSSSGKTQMELSKKFGVGQDEISRIINNKRFKYE